MRPEEIDYSDTRKHYFDLSNGEVLVGEEELAAYSEAKPGGCKTAELGRLLRDDGLAVQLTTTRYESLDVSAWDRDRYVAYGRWIRQIIAPPKRVSEQFINARVIQRARTLGIGPSQYAVVSEFGSRLVFYKEVGTLGEEKVSFDDWSIEDFVSYISKVGSKKKPTFKLFVELSRASEVPHPALMHKRFHDIGGFNKLVELAGYPMVKLWDKQDYVDWGVRFATANHGLLPTSRAADYLASKKLGPSGTGIISKFDSMGEFQKLTSIEYDAQQREKKTIEDELLTQIIKELRRKKIPVELLAGKEMAVDIKNIFESCSDTPATLEAFRESLDASMLLSRYARYILLRAVPTSMSDTTKAKAISRSSTNAFLKDVQKNRPTISRGELEHTALIEGIFDFLWPLDGGLKKLELGRGYEQYHMRRERVQFLRPVAI